MAKFTEKRYVLPYILITLLFFMWGFARSILDLLNTHFQESMDIKYSQTTLIQVSTYLAYFLMAIPAGMFIQRFGYRKGVVLGLSLFGAGAFIFIPGAELSSFNMFLLALFVLGCGLTFLETAANPYSTELGPKETATSRLNLSQTFNGMGCAIAPALVGGYLFSGGSVTIPYIIMGVVVLSVAFIFTRVELPEIKHEETEEPTSIEGNPYKQLFKHKMFLFGLFALLMYEVAEISINSYFMKFTTMEHVIDGVVTPGLMDPTTASMWLSGALFLFMGGRFIGSMVMTVVKAETILATCAIACVGCMAVILLGEGDGAVYALIANYFFEAIMFPTIFALTVRGMGDLTKAASSILMMTPVGGCFFLVVGYIAEAHALLPFAIPLAGYAVIALFALAKRK